jgi:hypothetical protein
MERPFDEMVTCLLLMRTTAMSCTIAGLIVRSDDITANLVLRTQVLRPLVNVLLNTHRYLYGCGRRHAHSNFLLTVTCLLCLEVLELIPCLNESPLDTIKQLA